MEFPAFGEFGEENAAQYYDDFEDGRRPPRPLFPPQVYLRLFPTVSLRASPSGLHLLEACLIGRLYQ